jgi:hypothetical protein
MYEHDRREDANVNDEANQCLGGDLGGLWQSIGHAVKGWEDRGKNHAGSKASPICLDPEAGMLSVRSILAIV